jgi:glycosyltransferase involved in cell wall biosynthesis
VIAKTTEGYSLKISNMTNFPRISVVTPSFNQADFLEQTIDSVLSQNYPNLRYIILDGGSTDKSLDIIRKYESHFYAWRSSPDQGTWLAILEGFRYAEEGWFNWLNSDDFLLPGSLSRLSELAQAYPNKRWISGARLDVDNQGRTMRAICPWLNNPQNIIFSEPFLPQDSTFFRVDLFAEAAQSVPTYLKNIFDTVLHRIAWNIEKPLLTNHVFSAMRWHESQLTSNKKQIAQEYESIKVLFKSHKSSMIKRFLKRISRTRFNTEVTALLKVMISHGAFDTKNIETCIYWPWELQSKLCSLSEAYAKYST